MSKETPCSEDRPTTEGKWRIRVEIGRDARTKRPVMIYYVSPGTYKYGFATFLDDMSAILYRDELNRMNIFHLQDDGT